MSWARADDRYDDTSKIKKAWRLSGYAVGLHWMSVTSSARHESDGIVDPEWLAERLGVIPTKDAKKAVETLVSLGLYEELPAGERRTVFDRHGNAVQLGPVEEDTFIVHDYLDYQDSAATLESRRADERLRKAIAAKAKESGLSISEYRKTPAFRVDFPPDSGRKPPGILGASEDPDPTRPDPTRPIPEAATPPRSRAEQSSRTMAEGVECPRCRVPAGEKCAGVRGPRESCHLERHHAVGELTHIAVKARGGGGKPDLKAAPAFEPDPVCEAIRAEHFPDTEPGTVESVVAYLRQKRMEPTVDAIRGLINGEAA